MHIVPPRQKATARRLRRDLTGPERKLWSQLRAHRLAHVHFRRQAPMGDIIVDFVAHTPRLVIEVDGDQHGYESGLQRDEKRDTWLASQGYQVLRFSNWQVMNEFENVLLTIEACIEHRRPLPSLPPDGGG